jgi:hypothetical protein
VRVGYSENGGWKQIIYQKNIEIKELIGNGSNDI